MKNLNFNILISFFHYVKYLLQLFEGLSQVKKLSDLKLLISCLVVQQRIDILPRYV